MFVHSFAEAYGWSYNECLRKTMPQIIMLSHMSDVNRRRLEKRTAKGKDTAKAPDPEQPIWHGKRLDEMTSAEYKEYSKQF